MAGIKISALPAIPVAVALTDIYPTVQAGVTYKATIAQLATILGFSGSPAILAMANGGTGAALTPALGAIPYSTATVMALLAPGTTGQLFRSGGAGAPTWTTSTYPATNAVNTLLWASSANVMAALATANSSVLVTSSGGIPSLSTVLPALTTVDPSTAQGLATKNYVDNIATGGGQPVNCATTANLNATYVNGVSGVGATLTDASGTFAAFTVDGQSPSVGARVLIKNQSSTFQNGVYILTTNGDTISIPYVLTRATDYDTVNDINDTGLIPVENGTANGNTAWYNTTTMVTIGTTALTFTSFGATGTVTSVSGAGLATGTVTTSGSITVTAALAADQVTGTSTTKAVTPGVQANHPSAAKIWGFIAASSGTIDSAYQLTSVTRNSAGDYTANFAITLGSGNYATLVTCGNNDGTSVFFGMAKTNTQGTTSIGIQTFNTSFAKADSNNTFQFAILCAS